MVLVRTPIKYGLLVIALAGCLAGAIYSGDGRLVDHGPLASDDRYELDFGPIDLRKTGEVRYRVGRLPDARFKIGLDIHFIEPLATLYEKPLSAVVAIELRDSGGRSVFIDERSLKDWTWRRSRLDADHAFVWLDGQYDFGGSFQAYYVLTFAVIHPDTSMRDYTARLAAKGGGWKAEQ